VSEGGVNEGEGVSKGKDVIEGECVSVSVSKGEGVSRRKRE